MDQPTDPLARQLALSALTTEQFNLQTARMGTIAEANGRSTLYLSTLSSAVIAIAFVRQANQLGATFYLFALTLLPPVFLLGVFRYLRLVQTSIEDLVYSVGSFRIRQYFLGLDPAAVPFFPPTGPEGVRKLERIGVLTTSPLQMLLTAASMVACINAMVGGIIPSGNDRPQRAMAVTQRRRSPEHPVLPRTEEVRRAAVLRKVPEASRLGHDHGIELPGFLEASYQNRRPRGTGGGRAAGLAIATPPGHAWEP